METKELLRRDLFNKFKELVSNYKNSTVNDLMDMLYHSKAPRYYVSYEHTRRYMGIISSGLPLTAVKNSRKKLMYIDIYKEWQKALEKQKYARYPYSALLDILQKPASSWYLSKSRIKHIIYSEIRKQKQLL